MKKLNNPFRSGGGAFDKNPLLKASFSGVAGGAFGMVFALVM